MQMGLGLLNASPIR